MYHNVHDIVRKNREIGLSFFSPDTMKFWSTRLSARIYTVPEGAFFVTSDVWGGGDRLYSVRFARNSGEVVNMTRLPRMGSLRAAHRLAARCASFPRSISEES